MGFTTGVLFCTNCGSSCVDVNSWEGPDKAILECSDCDHTAILEGFSVGRVQLSDKQLQAGAKDTSLLRGDPKIKRLILDATSERIKSDW